MNNPQHEVHTYPMRKQWQYINQFSGFVTWWGVLFQIIIFPFYLLLFEWSRKSFPAYRRMMAGERRSYLRVSDAGLVFRNWPLFEMQCKWQDVKSINWNRWLGDTLNLRRAVYIGYMEFSIRLGPPQIHLSSLVGWAEGELKEDMRRYAPQLFTDQS
jgi:hypothetical protein